MCQNLKLIWPEDLVFMRALPSLRLCFHFIILFRLCYEEKKKEALI